MRCELCQGTGRQGEEHWLPLPGRAVKVFRPCPDCQGSGWGHCCSGETAINDAAPVTPAAVQRREGA